MARIADIRGWLAAGLIGLVLAFSTAPCAARAASPDPMGLVAASYDPCRGAPLVPAAACVQLACQVLLRPAFEGCAARIAVNRAPFTISDDRSRGRSVAPVDPPPRPPMN
jgi:hypothetical protein